MRSLTKRPLSAIAIVVTLALGIGATTAIFAVIQGVLLQPLPYAESDRLLLVLEKFIAQDRLASMAALGYREYRDRNQSLESLVLTSNTSRNLVGEGDAERLFGSAVTGEFFRMLRLEPVLGRFIGPDDDRPGAPRVVVLSHRLWQRRFGGDRQVVGRVINLNGEPHEVIGVAPPQAYPLPREFFVPLALDWAADELGLRFYFPLARLRPGVSIDAARADLESIAASLRRTYPEEYEGFGVAVLPWHDWYARNLRPALLLLLAAVGVVLLVAGVNTANLLLARLAARENELAVRSALGAGRGDLIRVVVLESLLLTMVSGALAVILASQGLRVLVALYSGSLPVTVSIGLNGTVLLFAFVVCAVLGLLLGLFPALKASRPDLRAALGEGRGGTTGVHSRRLRSTLVLVEVALSVVLLIAAALLLRGFGRLVAQDRGFTPASVVTAKLDLEALFSSPDPSAAQEQQRVAFYRRLGEGLRDLPQAEASGLVSHLPLVPQAPTCPFYVEGQPRPALPDEWPLANYRLITPGYLEAMRIPLLEGRRLTERDDEGAVPVALVTEALARQHWPGQSPLGRRLKIFLASVDDPTPWREIVGVVGDVLDHKPGSNWPEQPEVYLPMLQAPGPTATLVLRTAVPPGDAASSLRGLMARIDPAQPLYEIQTMDAILDEALGEARFNTVLVSVFAGLALVLVAIGVYGVIAYGVDQRRRELAVRQAFGADGGRIVGLVVKQGMSVVAIGIAAGVAGALLSARWMSSQLYGVGTGDPAVWIGVLALLSLVAFAACWIPARRAVRVDPWTVLREE